MSRITPQNRAAQMLNAPLNVIIPRLAVPTIISMLVTAIYSMADTYFVSRISTEASAAVGVVFSAMTIIQALAFTVGMGSGSNTSRALGAGREDEAARFVSTGFFTTFTMGIAVLIAGNLNLDGIVRLLGATDEIAPHARAYAGYIFYAAPFMMCSFVMNNMLRFQGMASLAMIGITTGGLLNIALDPFFIFALGMGTAGAALATAMSQFVSFIILLVMCNTRRGVIPIRFRNFRPGRVIYGRIFYSGMPSLGRQGIASLATILLNRAAAGVSADPAVVSAAIASMSIVSRFVMFINSAVIGFGQGFQPVCAFCWGAGKYSRVRRAFFFCSKVATLILLALAALAFGFAGTIIRFFRAEDPYVVAIGIRALRLQLVTLPLWGFYVMSNMCTQSIGYGMRSLIISSARQGIFLIPMVLILPGALGILGLQLAQPCADVLAFALSCCLMSGLLRQMKEMPDRPHPLDAAGGQDVRAGN